jgi:DNA-binding XRE family transcriptional regulator
VAVSKLNTLLLIFHLTFLLFEVGFLGVASFLFLEVRKKRLKMFFVDATIDGIPPQKKLPIWQFLPSILKANAFLLFKGHHNPIDVLYFFLFLSKTFKTVEYMSFHINHLNITRKRSGLTQSDVATLMGFQEHTHVCRHEKGKRIPPIEMILSYHIIFDKSVEDLFYGYRKELIHNIQQRVPHLIQELKKLRPSPRLTERIKCLSNIYHRLTNLSKTS